MCSKIRAYENKNKKLEPRRKKHKKSSQAVVPPPPTPEIFQEDLFDENDSIRSNFWQDSFDKVFNAGKMELKGANLLKKQVRADYNANSSVENCEASWTSKSQDEKSRKTYGTVAAKSTHLDPKTHLTTNASTPNRNTIHKPSFSTISPIITYTPCGSSAQNDIVDTRDDAAKQAYTDENKHRAVKRKSDETETTANFKKSNYVHAKAVETLRRKLKELATNLGNDPVKKNPVKPKNQKEIVVEPVVITCSKENCNQKVVSPVPESKYYFRNKQKKKIETILKDNKDLLGKKLDEHYKLPLRYDENFIRDFLNFADQISANDKRPGRRRLNKPKQPKKQNPKLQKQKVPRRRNPSPVEEPIPSFSSDTSHEINRVVPAAKSTPVVEILDDQILASATNESITMDSLNTIGDVSKQLKYLGTLCEKGKQISPKPVTNSSISKINLFSMGPSETSSRKAFRDIIVGNSGESTLLDLSTKLSGEGLSESNQNNLEEKSVGNFDRISTSFNNQAFSTNGADSIACFGDGGRNETRDKRQSLELGLKTTETISLSAINSLDTWESKRASMQTKSRSEGFQKPENSNEEQSVQVANVESRSLSKSSIGNTELNLSKKNSSGTLELEESSYQLQNSHVYPAGTYVNHLDKNLSSRENLPLAGRITRQNAIRKYSLLRTARKMIDKDKSEEVITPVEVRGSSEEKSTHCRRDTKTKMLIEEGDSSETEIFEPNVGRNIEEIEKEAGPTRKTNCLKARLENVKIKKLTRRRDIYNESDKSTAVNDDECDSSETEIFELNQEKDFEKQNIQNKTKSRTVNHGDESDTSETEIFDLNLESESEKNVKKNPTRVICSPITNRLGEVLPEVEEKEVIKTQGNLHETDKSSEIEIFDLDKESEVERNVQRLRLLLTPKTQLLGDLPKGEKRKPNKRQDIKEAMTGRIADNRVERNFLETEEFHLHVGTESEREVDGIRIITENEQIASNPLTKRLRGRPNKADKSRLTEGQDIHHGTTMTKHLRSRVIKGTIHRGSVTSSENQNSNTVSIQEITEDDARKSNASSSYLKDVVNNLGKNLNRMKLLSADTQTKVQTEPVTLTNVLNTTISAKNNSKAEDFLGKDTLTSEDKNNSPRSNEVKLQEKSKKESTKCLNVKDLVRDHPNKVRQSEQTASTPYIKRLRARPRKLRKSNPIGRQDNHNEKANRTQEKGEHCESSEINICEPNLGRYSVLNDGEIRNDDVPIPISNRLKDSPQNVKENQAKESVSNVINDTGREDTRRKTTGDNIDSGSSNVETIRPRLTSVANRNPEEVRTHASRTPMKKRLRSHTKKSIEVKANRSPSLRREETASTITLSNNSHSSSNREISTGTSYRARISSSQNKNLEPVSTSESAEKVSSKSNSSSLYVQYLLRNLRVKLKRIRLPSPDTQTKVQIEPVIASNDSNKGIHEKSSSKPHEFVEMDDPNSVQSVPATVCRLRENSETDRHSQSNVANQSTSLVALAENENSLPRSKDLMVQDKSVEGESTNNLHLEKDAAPLDLSLGRRELSDISVARRPILKMKSIEQFKESFESFKKLTFSRTSDQIMSVLDLSIDKESFLKTIAERTRTSKECNISSIKKTSVVNVSAASANSSNSVQVIEEEAAKSVTKSLSKRSSTANTSKLILKGGKWRRRISFFRKSSLIIDYDSLCSSTKETSRKTVEAFTNPEPVSRRVTKLPDLSGLMEASKESTFLLEPTDDEAPNLPPSALLDNSTLGKKLQNSLQYIESIATAAKSVVDFDVPTEDIDQQFNDSTTERRRTYQQQLSTPQYLNRQTTVVSATRRRRTSFVEELRTPGTNQFNQLGLLPIEPSIRLEHPHLKTRNVVLRRCGQSEPIEFSSIYSEENLLNCRKIGEGVYGEVFMNKTPSGEAIVLKIIPIEGTIEVNGEPQKKFDEILSEIIIAMELSKLRHDKELMTSGFVEVRNVRCVQGCYPEQLIDLWELYRDNCGTENDHPGIFQEDQLYIVLELANGGRDLEAFTFQNALQSYSAFVQTAITLAVAEKKFQFEHRDLHWGNILLSHTEEKNIKFIVNGSEIKIPTHGVKVTIIDYTLSRMVFEGCCLYNDLSNDEELFSASGDYQFDIYRFMKQRLDNDWQNYEPHTNVLWLHYTIDKMINGARYQNTKSKKHRSAINDMMQLRDELLDFESASDYVDSLN